MADPINDKGIIEENKGNDSNQQANDIVSENFIIRIIDFIRNIFSFNDGFIAYSTVVKETTEGIAVKGYNVWILMCSIAIASVGLNVNSTAVIVGAMLISPLMGPIRGIGLGIGINDFDLLIRSLKNLAITVGVSLGVSFLYFLISPMDTLTDQLFIRTKPNFLDVVVAFFGGLAGVLAAVKGKNDTVIPGVAIATALMPPLCTAGYGLAVGNFSFFIGAMYLFVINSVLIALSSLLIVRFLKFPKKEYLNPNIEKKAKNYIIIFMVLIIAPSTYLFYGMIKSTLFERNATEFVENVIKTSTTGKVKHEVEYSRDTVYIDISIQGDIISQKTQVLWRKQMIKYHLDEKTSLNIYQDGDYKSFIDEKLKDVMANGIGSKELVNIIMVKDERINALQNKIDSINYKGVVSSLKYNEIIKDFKIDYPECNDIMINRSFKTNDSGETDTLFTIGLSFKGNVTLKDKNQIKRNLSKKLLFRLKQRDYNKQDSVPVFLF